MKKQHLIFLILGIAATVLFVLFGEWFYELRYVNGFSDDMHNLELNMTVSLITALLPWAASAATASGSKLSSPSPPLYS